jgi:hypothetical protein
MKQAEIARRGKVGLMIMSMLVEARKKLQQEILTEARIGKPLGKKAVVERLGTGNRLFLEIMKNQSIPVWIKNMIVLGLCCDARPTKLGMATSLGGLETKQGHVAANAITSEIFKNLNKDGFAAMIGHCPACGGVEAVNSWLKGVVEKGERMLELKAMVCEKIIEGENPELRSVINAEKQAWRVEREAVRKKVYSGLIDLSPDNEGEYLNFREFTMESGTHKAIAETLKAEAKLIMDGAYAEGIDPNPHSAMLVLVYDPEDVGPISPVLASLAMMPREVFTVTELSGAGIASIQYAISHGGTGHVEGIGGKDGSRLIWTPASCKSKSDQIVNIILADPELKEATKGGETILQSEYNPKTMENKFHL